MNSEVNGPEVNSHEEYQEKMSFSQTNHDQGSWYAKQRHDINTNIYPESSQNLKNKAFEGVIVGGNILNSIFKQIAFHLRKKSKRKVYSRVYYTKRNSMIHLGNPMGDDASEWSVPQIRAFDDINVVLTAKEQKTDERFRRRDRKRTSMLANDVINMIVAECLEHEAVKNSVINEKTLEFIDIVRARISEPRLLKKKLIQGITNLNFSKPKPLALQKGNQPSIIPKKHQENPPYNLQSSKSGSKELLPGVLIPMSKSSTGQGLHHIHTRDKSIKSGQVKLNAETLNKARDRLCGYLEIMQFLCSFLNLTELANKLMLNSPYLKDASKQENVLSQLIQSKTFMETLIRQLVSFGELKIFQLLMESITGWQLIFSESILDQFIGEAGVEFLMIMLKEFNLRHSKLGLGAKRFSKTQTNGELDQLSMDIREKKSNLMPGHRLRKVLPMLLNTEDSVQANTVIIDFLKNLNLSNKLIVKLILGLQEESRVMSILTQNGYLVKDIEVRDIINNKMYPLLALIDPLELINVLNLSTSNDSYAASTVYHVLCERIKQGSGTESICNLVMKVNQTFWDFDKIWKLYLAVSELTKFESDSKWLADISNPLLFFMKLANFFMHSSKSLDIDSKDISNFVEEIVDFCKLYIQNTSEETLLLQLTDRDFRGFSFYEYAFRVRGMSILEIDFVANVILQMWDLSRKSKQSFLDFFKLAVLPNETKKFSWKVFKKTYTIPVEDSDMFQLEYFLASRSTYLSVVSEIIWTTVLACAEFYFSLLLSSMYIQKGEMFFDKSLSWVNELAHSNTVFFYAFIGIRASSIVNWAVKSFIIQTHNEVGRQLMLFFKVLLALYCCQIIGYPILFQESFMAANMLQMAVTLTVIGYTLFLGLSLNNLGVLLRIFARMLLVVIVFAVVSIVVITIIAYPVHTFFLEFTQEVAGEDFPEQNKFRNLYNGVLTLFEFVFGAVIFVRPYKEQNFYSVSMTFFMVIFSFFGNIMLANMLIAFLASQFSSIEQKATYYTLRMQFGLTKVLKGKDLDAVYSIPFIFHLPSLPIYLLMLKDGPLRKKLNRFLRKFIFLLNVFLPWFFLYFVYLLLLMVKVYIGMFFKIISGITESKFKTPLYLILWSIIGLPFLAKLGCDDIWLVVSTLLNFRDTPEEDLFQISITANDRGFFLTAFRKIFKVALSLQKKDIQTIGLGSFIYEIGQMYPQTFYRERGADTSPEGNLSLDDSKFEFIQMNKNNYLFKKKYSSENVKMYAALLKKYVNLDDSLASSSRSQSEIDIGFLLARLKGNLSLDKVHILVTVDKLNLEKARKAFNKSAEIGLKAELSDINSRIEEMSKDMATIIKHVMRIDHKTTQIIRPFPDMSTPKSAYKIAVNG